MTPKGPRAAIYVRLSRDRVGETSTARQEADTRALAQARNFEVVEVFSDVDLSAYKEGIVRPAYGRCSPPPRPATSTPSWSGRSTA